MLKELNDRAGVAEAKGVGKGGGKGAGKEVEKTAVKEVEKAAVKEGEEVAAKAAGKGKLLERIAGKLGIELVEALIPDPLDALELMYDFAGSYKEAWEKLERDNRTRGFAIGLAAYLIIPRWDWALCHARTVVSRDVATQVVGAVGLAENAYNDGLVRGFVYGERHSRAAADRLRQKAFDWLVRHERMPGHYEGDDVYTFGRDDVYSFAAALYPTAVAVLAEADRRRKAREESERLRRDMIRWSRRQPGEV